MLFNSYEFLLLFLPGVFALFWGGSRSVRYRLMVLTAASYFFYSWWQFDGIDDFLRSFQFGSWGGIKSMLWHWRFTLIMLISTSVDYFAAKLIASTPAPIARKALLAASMTANLGLLAFFKYFGFFTQIASTVSQAVGAGKLPIIELILPVGISFYTFESMSYTIDVYRGLAKPAASYLDYACFVSMFPHLVAGPIIRYSDILHQFREDDRFTRRAPEWNRVGLGLLFLTMGLAKKMLIADRLAEWINPYWSGFHLGKPLRVTTCWAAVLGYTYQIYFDFSGYSDMAVGLGHMFMIKFPQNFDSPYKATDASDFWRRWHITLSTFLRDYLYIPLGGNRRGSFFQYRNLLITMLLGGLWHGAAWHFVVWGGWWGLMLVGHHFMSRRKWLPSTERLSGYWFNRCLTFFLVVVGWVFFRAADLPAAGRMLKNLFGLVHSKGHSLSSPTSALWVTLALCCVWCSFLPNSFEVAENLKLRKRYAVLAGATLAMCVLSLGQRSVFLYFQF